MAITLTTVPDHAFPGVVTLATTASAGGNYVTYWCTDAPLGSSLRVALDADENNRILIHEGAICCTHDADMEIGGAYTFVCQEMTKNATAHGGGYTNDPNGFQSKTKVGAENTQTVYVGQKLSRRLGCSCFGTAELLLWVWNTTVRPTTIKSHGEITPAIVKPSTSNAETAALDTTVATKLAALGDVLASLLIGNLNSLCDDMRTNIPLHFNNNGGVYHNGAPPVPDIDNDTEIERMTGTPTTPAGFSTFASIVWRRLHNHMANWDGSAEKTYHNAGGVFTPDYVNAFASSQPGDSDMAGSTSALADIYRAYVAHIADATVHAAADTTNELTITPGLLLDLEQAFLDAQRKLSPTNPTTRNPGATVLIHGAGCHEIPPSI